MWYATSLWSSSCSWWGINTHMIMGNINSVVVCWKILRWGGGGVPSHSYSFLSTIMRRSGALWSFMHTIFQQKELHLYAMDSPGYLYICSLLYSKLLPPQCIFDHAGTRHHGWDNPHPREGHIGGPPFYGFLWTSGPPPWFPAEGVTFIHTPTLICRWFSEWYDVLLYLWFLGSYICPEVFP